MRYRVTIYYCEPLYAQSRGIPLKEQRGTFEVDAHSEGQATSMAVEAFKEAARRSSVGWHREIVRVVLSRQSDAIVDGEDVDGDGRISSRAPALGMQLPQPAIAGTATVSSHMQLPQPAIPEIATVQEAVSSVKPAPERTKGLSIVVALAVLGGAACFAYAMWGF